MVPFSTLDLTFYEQLGIAELSMLIRSVHLVSSWRSRSCSFTFVTLYVLLWLFNVLCCSFAVFHVRSLSMDYILLISAGILVPFITLFALRKT